MADKKTGLPENFSLNPADVPTAIGDYFDEEEAIRARVLEAKVKKAAEGGRGGITQGILGKTALFKPSGTEPQTSPLPEAPIELNKEVPPAALEAGKEATLKEGSIPLRRPLSPAWKRPRRKQLNISPDTERRLEDLVEHFCRYGPETDTKMSEIFEALVLLAHESKERLALSGLPRRGAWGSPTEKNFPAVLAEALGKAIAERNIEWPKAENG